MTKQTKTFCWKFWLLKYGICQISGTYPTKTTTAFKNERNAPHCSNVTLLRCRRKTFSSKYRSRFGAVSYRPSEKAAWRYYVLYQESGYVVRMIQESLRSDYCVRQDAAGILRDGAARLDPFQVQVSGEVP